MAIASNLGYPRLGYHRQLKQAVEKYWAGQISAQDLLATGKAIRTKNWQLQKDRAFRTYRPMILHFTIIFLMLPSHLVLFPLGIQ